MQTLTDVEDFQAFWLPDDAVVAIAADLAVLHSPGDTFGDAFGLNWQADAEEIIKADVNGVRQDWNIDYTQSTTPTNVPILKSIVAGFQSTKTGSCLTIVTSPSGHIAHQKSIISAATDGGKYWCRTGSENITFVATEETNHLLIFRSNQFALVQIAQHNALKAFARQRHPERQLMALPT